MRGALVMTTLPVADLTTASSPSTLIFPQIAIGGEFGFSGDGGSTTAASLSLPMGIALDAGGNLFFADSFNDRVRRVDHTTGVITTVAGNGQRGFSGDGGPATAASLIFPTGVAVD